MGPPMRDASPMTPVLHRVTGRRRETEDVVTLSLEPVAGPALVFAAGQFNMLTAFGVGEAAISVSSAPDVPPPLQHTVRDVGSVTHALCASQIGDLVGVRGPFGTDWGRADVPTDQSEGSGSNDVVIVAGGIGLAPLRGITRALLARRDSDRVFVLAGARSPDQVVFADDLDSWARMGAHVAVTVDVGTPGWNGHVGVVTTLLGGAGFNPAQTTALICGPEIMMRFTARGLLDLGVNPDRIWVSLERNMQCGLAWCGHCQLGPFLLCRDGPIVPYAGAVAELLMQRER
jgi:anaerobic sulfite reductase subunit B